MFHIQKIPLSRLLPLKKKNHETLKTHEDYILSCISCVSWFNVALSPVSTGQKPPNKKSPEPAARSGQFWTFFTSFKSDSAW